MSDPTCIPALVASKDWKPLHIFSHSSFLYLAHGITCPGRKGSGAELCVLVGGLGPHLCPHGSQH